MQSTDKQCFSVRLNLLVTECSLFINGTSGGVMKGSEQGNYFFFPRLTVKNNFSPLGNGHNFSVFQLLKFR